MNIYSAEQIRDWDRFTIQNEPVRSIDLMERAAQACVDWILAQPYARQRIKIFCGKGNNGGDGLAIARLLWSNGIKSEVFILEFGKLGTEDFQYNLQSLHELPITIQFIQSPDHFPSLERDDIVLDALFGSGLNKPLEGLSAELVRHITAASPLVLSIDLPSGLFADQSSAGAVTIKATHTLTFQVYKLALMMAENAPYIGTVHVLDIGLHPAFHKQSHPGKILIDQALVSGLFVPRNRFAHKGTYGHALLVGGSYGKMGAILLSTKACLRSGAGLVTTYAPKCGYEILQTTVPEAMVISDESQEKLSCLPPDLGRFNAIGIGPGMGTNEDTANMLFEILTTYREPVVLDADALNCLAKSGGNLQNVPKNSVLTPHPKEFERMFGPCTNDFERMTLAQNKAIELSVVIVLKGHHTLICLPDGTLYFNSTGNPGMANGGSGDVLTGIITAFCAQGYLPSHAAILGVYIHGLAGDRAAHALSMEAMVASDIITFLSQGYIELNR